MLIPTVSVVQCTGGYSPVEFRRKRLHPFPLTMSSEVFILSSTRGPNTSITVQAAVELAGIEMPRVQDALFGLGAPLVDFDPASTSRAVGLNCPVAVISPALRAVLFAAASMLSDDVSLSLVVTLAAGDCAALVLASPEAVGRLNLLPRARIAARSLSGPEPALRFAGLVSSDLDIRKDAGQPALLLADLLDELDAQQARWGLVSADRLTVLVERL